MNQAELDTVGRTLAVELGLKMNKLKRYPLTGGSKTNEGLLRTVVRILNDNGITATIPEETEQPTVLKLSNKMRTIPIEPKWGGMTTDKLNARRALRKLANDGKLTELRAAFDHTISIHPEIGCYVICKQCETETPHIEGECQFCGTHT